MAIRNLRMLGDGILNKVSKPVENFDSKLHSLLDDMNDTMKKHSGMGIASPQVGVLKRVVLIDIPQEQEDDKKNKKNRKNRKKYEEGEYGTYELVNPVITETEGEEEMFEACLSFPGKNAPLVRPSRITVKAWDRHGTEYTINAKGVLARALCHEIDHLDGIMYTDLIAPGTLRDNDDDDK
jgi:peptide deformylase